MNDVKPVNDVYEWILIKKDKKTLVRCETNPFASLGQVSEDSMVCKIYDYNKDEKIREDLMKNMDRLKHEKAVIRIEPDYVSLDTTRGREYPKYVKKSWMK